MKNYQKAIALLTVAGVLLGTASPLAGHAAAAATKASTSTQASLKGVDAKLITAAQKKLQEVTGKTYTFNKAEKWSADNNTGWDLQIKEAAHSYVSIGVNGQVDRIMLDQKWSDLKEEYKRQIKDALQKSAPGSTSVPETVTLTIGYPDVYMNAGKLELFTQVDDQLLTLLDGKIERIMTSLNPEDVPEAVMQAVDAIKEGLGNVEKGELTKASAAIDGKGEKTYELMFASQDPKSPIFINVKEATGRISKAYISPLEDSVTEYTQGYSQLKNYTVKQLSENAKPSAQHFLNIDLTGYTAIKDEEKPGTVVFSKKNAPSIKGQYNTKGQFYNLEVYL
ncbi:hypothetical protein ABEO75_12510 [Paenibacillus macerans]|uniref:hypothetical protein n=1 Tax=Paenibacillus macerans TaxID=44252 RepID=UPI002E1E205B|nr:hypothetical protein [Paenibacillus macerans]